MEIWDWEDCPFEASDRDEIWLYRVAGVLDLLMVHMVLLGMAFFFSLYILYDIKDGSRVKFWQDRWRSETSLAANYLELFRFCRDKDASVAELIKSANGALFWDVSFFRGVHAWELEAMSGFMDTTYGSSYGSSVKGFGEDKICWKLDKDSGSKLRIIIVF